MQNECYKIKRIKLLYQNLDKIDWHPFLFPGFQALKLAHFIFVCCMKHSVNRYSNAATNFIMSFSLFAFRRVWVDFNENWNIMILLKFVKSFQLALNSDTVKDTGPKEIYTELSSLNRQLVSSFCKPWSCVGNGVRHHLFLFSTLNRNRWSNAHWPHDPQIV